MLKTTLDDDLTENPRIYDAIDVDGHQYTVSVPDNQVHMAGYLNQLWQWVCNAAWLHTRGPLDAASGLDALSGRSVTADLVGGHRVWPLDCLRLRRTPWSAGRSYSVCRWL